MPSESPPKPPQTGKLAQKKGKLTPLEQQIAELKAFLPAQHDWHTTDEREIARRQVRALESNKPTSESIEIRIQPSL